MLVDLTDEQIKQLLYELDYRQGELLGGGDTEQAYALASITDKIRTANSIKALELAVDYESKNLDESSFENDGQYHWAVGHADGLSDAIRIAKGEDWRKVVDYEE